MASTSSPLTAAHQHAASAEDYVEQGLLVLAAEEHYKAAEAFLACVEASNDEGTKRTLKMLYNDQCNKGKELQRQIAKLREENKDPNLPHKPPTRTKAPAVAATPSPPQPSTSSGIQRPSRMSESEQMVDESFMLLGQSRSDPNDAFNHFWKITEGMLDYLSQPVAFATAPLSASMSKSRRDGGSSSDTDIEDPISRNISRGINLIKATGSRILTRHDSSSNVADLGNKHAGLSKRSTADSDPAEISDDWDDDVEEEYDDMADSFCLVRSDTESSVSVLRKENAAYKTKLEEMQQQLVSAERMLKMRHDQDQQLRESIILARKEAHRAMVSSAVVSRGPSAVDLTALNLNVPPPVPPAVPALSPGREAQLLRRIRELEDEVRTVRVEQEKQKAMIVRYRERWEKLKESSKRKKEAKARATSVVGQRIDEEPEAEAAAERDVETPHGD